MNCLPKNIKENDIIPEEKVTIHDLIVWNSSINERITYDRNFCSHLRDLGTYAEFLDVSIDKYGFENDWSSLLGKAAFLQVGN